MGNNLTLTAASLSEPNAGRAFDANIVNVAHDLKNVLTVLRSCCCLLARDHTDAARKRDTLDAMGRAVDRVTALVGSLLAPEPRVAVGETGFDVEAALLQARALLQASCGQEAAVQVCGLRGTPLMIEGAQEAFEAALLNLVLNARDASAEGGVITIEVRPGEPGRPWPGDVQVSVSDTGRGITPELQARIFEPFFTTKPDRPGAGVGLLQVKDFARRSNARISVSSVPGKGSTFTMHLNRAAPQRM